MATKIKRNSRKTVKRPAIRGLSSRLYFGTRRYWTLEKNQLFAVRGIFYRVRSPFHARSVFSWGVKLMLPWTKVDTYFSGPQRTVAESLRALHKYNSGVK